MFKETWKKMKEFWARNMETEYKNISRAIGVFLIAILTSLAAAATFIAMGVEVNWGFTIAEIIGAAKILGILFLASFFGKDKTNGENGSEKEPVSN